MSELDNQQVLLSLLDQVQEDPEGILADTGLQPVLGKGEEILDLDESFDFEGFQVVRREFFAHQSEPSVTFNNCKFYVNSACLTKFPTVQYVQVLVNRDSIGGLIGFLCNRKQMHLSLLVQILVIKLEGQGIDRVVMDVQIELKTTTNDEDDVGSKLFFQSLQIALDSNGDGVINSGFQGRAGCGESLLLFFIFRIHFTQDVFNLSHDGLGVDQLINERMYSVHKIISFQSAAFQRGQLRNSLCRMLSKPTMRIIVRICATDNALVL